MTVVIVGKRDDWQLTREFKPAICGLGNQITMFMLMRSETMETSPRLLSNSSIAILSSWNPINKVPNSSYDL